MDTKECEARELDQKFWTMYKNLDGLCAIVKHMKDRVRVYKDSMDSICESPEYLDKLENLTFAREFYKLIKNFEDNVEPMDEAIGKYREVLVEAENAGQYLPIKLGARGASVDSKFTSLMMSLYAIEEKANANPTLASIAQSMPFGGTYTGTDALDNLDVSRK